MLAEIEGEEADCFAQIPVYLLHLLESDNRKTKVQFQANEQTGAFQAVAVAPGATISAHRRIRQFYSTSLKTPLRSEAVCRPSNPLTNLIILTDLKMGSWGISRTGHREPSTPHLLPFHLSRHSHHSFCYSITALRLTKHPRP